MRWECTECGYSGEAAEAPHVCVCCGTAAGFFLKAEAGLDGGDAGETWYDTWLQSGMARAEAPLRHRRHHPAVTRK